jgi:hypothetical protein
MEAAQNYCHDYIYNDRDEVVDESTLKPFYLMRKWGYHHNLKLKPTVTA